MKARVWVMAPIFHGGPCLRSVCGRRVDGYHYVGETSVGWCTGDTVMALL